MSSDMAPSWVTVTFYAFTDVTGVEFIYTGDGDLVFSLVFSDGTVEEVRIIILMSIYTNVKYYNKYSGCTHDYNY